jgi:hypothetical protein
MDISSNVNLIETFKIITGIYDNEVTEDIFDLDPNTRTRGHSKKIKKKFCKINLRKFVAILSCKLSDYCLTPNNAIIQLCHGENKLG